MILDNEICLVTGATRGIGRAIAETLGRAGATVVGTATSEKGAKTISEYLDSAGIDGNGLVLDVTDGNAVSESIELLTQKFGAPSILVNNAGITRDNLLLRIKEDDWDQVFDTNLKSAYRLCQTCIRAMTKARRGRIINIASVVAAIGNAGQCNYAATKAGLIGFTKSLAQEVASRNITVNAIAPGFIDTDMTRHITEAQRESLLAQIPLGRLGAPEDVAAAVLFLAGPGGNYITGTTLHVNGGMHMN